MLEFETMLSGFLRVLFIPLVLWGIIHGVGSALMMLGMIGTATKAKIKGENAGDALRKYFD